MAGAIQYRCGMCATTGKVLVGAAHLSQSLAIIWRTRPGERVMRLEFGTDLRSHLAEDITPALALTIYNELVAAAARYEPEYVLQTLQLVHLTADGALGIRHSGFYFPEGRLGNYAIAQPFSGAPASLVPSLPSSLKALP